ncbi:MAG TPA: BrnT family toxin [Candidatus Ornithospirochaeta avicola]|uniref:BrnT family toxin n=1 Tax=Candidatus Ornithospirochaeta avicola TaxID=2840896 RepID=A0A9D1PUB9_9SPIO|nr:BrnT family toxin [Candidatus Ornithospirochaeta avicola]
MQFEWDEEKNIANIKKHDGISFHMAVRVFLDGNRIERYDCKHSIDEDRYNVIGMVERLLFVVYTERDADTIRIISARKATKEECNEYYKKNDN